MIKFIQKYFGKSFFVIILSFILFITHTLVVYNLPAPFVFLNIVLVSSVAIFLIKGIKNSVAIVVICGFFFDILNGTNFGLHFLSMSVAILVAYAVYQRFITNNTFFSTVTLTIICLVTFRILYLSIVQFRFWQLEGNFINHNFFAYAIGAELVVSIIFSAILYFITARWFTSFGKQKYI
jgi:hypothetical protein